MVVRRLDVLVCGAGIAGTTVAALLGRTGHRVTLVERDQGARSSGAPVDVRAGAFGVVQGLGLIPRLRMLATSVRRLVVVDAAGRPLAAMPTRRSPDRELEVPRGDLCAALLSVAREEADLRFDETVTAIAPDGPGAVATLARGGDRRFDLVVGADGLHSVVRRLAFGPERDHVIPLGLYIATVRLPDPLEQQDTVLLHNEPGRAIALHPGSGEPGAAFLFRSARRIDSRDRESAERLLTEVYAGSGWRTPELLAAYAASGDRYFDAVSRVRLPAWSRGAVTLLGDAASAVSLFGEGSSAAVLGAAALAASLDRFPGDVPAALAHYESRHRPLTERWQRRAPLAARVLIPATARGIALRDAALRAAAPILRS